MGSLQLEYGPPISRYSPGQAQQLGTKVASTKELGHTDERQKTVFIEGSSLFEFDFFFNSKMDVKDELESTPRLKSYVF